jgi:hypothetical protein
MRLNSEKTPAAGEKFGGSRYGHAGVQVGSSEGVIGPCRCPKRFFEDSLLH